MYQFCAEHNIPHERCGKLVVAMTEQELPALLELERRGQANGLQNLRRLAGQELRQYEPHVAGIAGLFVSETGIVDYLAVTRAYARIISDCGGTIRLGCRFLSLTNQGQDLVLATSQGPITCRMVVNCAGLFSDRVARTCGIATPIRIVPFRGEYYKLRPHSESLVKSLIYPVPDPEYPFLGVHFTRMIHGGVEAGPNAVLAFQREGYRYWDISLRDMAELLLFPGFWKMAARHYRMGMGEFYRSLNKSIFVRSLRRLLPEIGAADVYRQGAGVRAQALDSDGKLVDDFRIVEGERMVHVLNAPSPAATASISIGRKIAQMVEKLL